MKLLLTILILFSASKLASQDCGLRDVESALRLGSTVGYNVDDNWTLDLSWESRIENDISQYVESLIDVSANYKFFSGVKLHGIYRHNFNIGSDDVYRLTLGGSYARFFSYTDLEWGIRSRIQRDHFYINSDAVYTLRNKFSLIYEINQKLGLVIEDEVFRTIGQDAQWSRNRINTGIEWKVTSDIELIAFYRFENDLNTKVADIVHTIGLYMEYVIKSETVKALKPVDHFGHPYRW